MKYPQGKRIKIIIGIIFWLKRVFKNINFQNQIEKRRIHAYNTYI